jgi:phage terminase Nu1 subunit (DNA packaging protein)
VDETRLKHFELAKVLRIKPCTVRFWTRFGCPYEPAGRLRFYNLNEVKAWLRERDEQRKAAK